MDEFSTVYGIVLVVSSLLGLGHRYYHMWKNTACLLVGESQNKSPVDWGVWGATIPSLESH